LGDYFRFAVERTAKLDELLEGATARYHVSAYLAGRRFEELTLDVGFGEPPVGGSEWLRGTDLLSFAEIAPIEVPALPLEQHVAEKVHAYCRAYADGRASSRVKDLVDLVVILSLFPFQAGRLRSALYATFDARGVRPLPPELPPPPSGWDLAYRKMAAEVRLAPDVSIGYRQAAAFLNPILRGAVSDNAGWDPLRSTW